MMITETTTTSGHDNNNDSPHLAGKWGFLHELAECAAVDADAINRPKDGTTPPTTSTSRDLFVVDV